MAIFPIQADPRGRETKVRWDSRPTGRDDKRAVGPPRLYAPARATASQGKETEGCPCLSLYDCVLYHTSN